MSKLQKLQCDNCGGHIDGDTLRCQSCGMQYRLQDDFTLGRVEVYNGKFVIINGKVGIPSYALYEFGDDGPRIACEMTLKELTEGMAKKILPFMEFRQCFNPHTMMLETYTEIKVAEPRVKSDVRWMYESFNEFGR